MVNNLYVELNVFLIFFFSGCIDNICSSFDYSLCSLYPIYSIFLILQPNDHDHGTDEVAEFMLAVSKDHIQVSHLCVSGSHSVFV